MRILLLAGLLVACAPANLSAPDVTGASSGTVLDISRVTSGDAMEFYPRVSPDGKSIAYQVRTSSRTLTQTNSLPPDNLTIEITTTTGVGQRLFAAPGSNQPAWLPDSSGMVYLYPSGNVYVMVRSAITGGGITFISQRPFGTNDRWPDVSPDGKRIAFTTTINGTATIATVGIDGSAFTIFTPGNRPRWSPDGKLLLFDRQVGSRLQLFTLNIESGQVTQLTSGNFNSQYATWSPDGKRIAFGSDRTGTYQIYVMAADGTNVTQLTRSSGESIEPSWGADGYIYFSSRAIDTFALPSSTPGTLSTGPSDIWKIRPAN